MTDLEIEVTHESWLSRIMESIKGVLFGLVLFIAAFPLLFMNEGCAVKTAKSLNEAQGVVVSVASSKVDSANQNKLVHTSGMLKSSEVLVDPSFKLKVKAIRLERQVEMYQWTETVKSETKKKLGGGTKTVKEYRYSKEWKSELVKSSKFRTERGHRNPSRMPFKANTQTAKVVNLGAFKLSGALRSSLTDSTSVKLTDAFIKGMPPALKSRFTVVENTLHSGKADEPIVGDVRIRFTAVYPKEVTVVAKQFSGSLVPYKTSNGKTISMLRAGKIDSQGMFKMAHADNKMVTWIIRFAGFLMLLIGIALIVNPLVVVADVVPFVGDFLGGGVAIFSFLLSLGFSMLTISIGWLTYRPLIGVPLLVVSVLAFGGLFATKKKKPVDELPAA